MRTLCVCYTRKKIPNTSGTKVSDENFSLYIITINLYLNLNEPNEQRVVSVQMCISRYECVIRYCFYPRHLFSFTCSDFCSTDFLFLRSFLFRNSLRYGKYKIKKKITAFIFSQRTKNAVEKMLR